MIEQTKLFQQLWQTKSDGRLPHALLFLGPKGTHKAKCALAFSRALLCETTSVTGESCGICQSCRLAVNRSHPDILWVETDATSKVIKVDQVREVSDFVAQTALRDTMRIVIIHPADKMNLMASNALLKTLEEPPPASLLILISDQQGQMPATIFSRCQRILFPSPTPDEKMAWLSSQPGRQDLFQILTRLIDNNGCPVQSAESLQQHDPMALLDFLLSWIVDVLRLQLNSESDRLINKDYLSHLMQVRQKTQLKLNVKLMEYIQHLRTQLFTGVNLNKQMMIEAILMRWMESASCF